MRAEEKGIGCLFVAWFAFVALVALSSLGFGAWAIYELITWLTTK